MNTENPFLQCNRCGAQMPYIDGKPPAFCSCCGTPFGAVNMQNQVPDNGMQYPPQQYPQQQYQQPVYIQQPIVYREVVEEPKKKKSGCLAWIVLIILIVLVLAVFVPAYNRYKDKSDLAESTSKQSTNRADYKTIAYEDLARNPERYKGDLVKFTGEVLQVMESSGKTQIRLATKKQEYFDGYSGDVVFCEFLPSIVNGRVLEGDIITVYGESKGLQKYKAVLGNEITIPALTVSIIDAQKKE